MKSFKVKTGGFYLTAFGPPPILKTGESSEKIGKILTVDEESTKMTAWDVSVKSSGPLAATSRSGKTSGKRQKPAKLMSVNAVKKNGRIHQFGDYGYDDEDAEWYISYLFFLADGSLVTSGNDRCIKRWDVATGDCLLSIKDAYTDGVDHIAAMPSSAAGPALTARTTHTVYKKSSAISEAAPLSNIDNQRICSVGRSDGICYVKIWNANTGMLECVLDCHQMSFSAFTALRDGLSIVGGSGTGVVTMWTLPVRYMASAMMDSTQPIQTSYYVSAVTDTTIRRARAPIATASATVTATTLSETSQQLTPSRTLLGHTDKVTCFVELSNNRLASSCKDGTIRIWDLSMAVGRDCCARIIRAPTKPDFLAVLGDGKTLISAERSYMGGVQLWDTVCGNTVNPLLTKLYLYGMAVTTDLAVLADGVTIAWVDDDNKINLFRPPQL